MRLLTHRVVRYWLVLSVLSAPLMVHAGIELSGFGTLGAALSDQDFIYQRYLDDGGTLNRDSLVGLQLDAPLTETWGMTLQAKLAPSTHDDNAWEPTLTWAFLSWRPSNVLLLRVGKLRIPLLLYSASSDVGTTYDFVRLPTEVYAPLPTTDINGLALAKTWFAGEREWTLEGYLGQAHADWRYFMREDIPPDFPAGDLYLGLDLEMAGLVLSLNDSRNIWRIGLHRAGAEFDQGPVPSDYPFVSIGPGLGYYQMSNALPGPGVPTIDQVDLSVLTLSAEIALPRDFRFIGEYARRRILNATMGPDTHVGYLALLRDIGRWTPYVLWTGIRSLDARLNFYERLNDNPLPESIPGAAALNAIQRLGSDLLSPYDQQSIAVGTSYSLSPGSKIKIGWMHTRIGRVSSFVDPPVGEESGGRQINVFSLSYNFTF